MTWLNKAHLKNNKKRGILGIIANLNLVIFLLLDNMLYRQPTIYHIENSDTTVLNMTDISNKLIRD